jgi:hypothetical protein
VLYITLRPAQRLVQGPLLLLLLLLLAGPCARPSPLETQGVLLLRLGLRLLLMLLECWRHKRPHALLLLLLVGRSAAATTAACTVDVSGRGWGRWLLRRAAGPVGAGCWTHQATA